MAALWPRPRAHHPIPAPRCELQFPGTFGLRLLTVAHACPRCGRYEHNAEISRLNSRRWRVDLDEQLNEERRRLRSLAAEAPGWGTDVQDDGIEATLAEHEPLDVVAQGQDLAALDGRIEAARRSSPVKGAGGAGSSGASPG